MLLILYRCNQQETVMPLASSSATRTALKAPHCLALRECPAIQSMSGERAPWLGAVLAWREIQSLADCAPLTTRSLKLPRRWPRKLLAVLEGNQTIRTFTTKASTECSESEAMSWPIDQINLEQGFYLLNRMYPPSFLHYYFIVIWWGFGVRVRVRVRVEMSITDVYGMCRHTTGWP